MKFSDINKMVYEIFENNIVIYRYKILFNISQRYDNSIFINKYIEYSIPLKIFNNKINIRFVLNLNIYRWLNLSETATFSYNIYRYSLCKEITKL